jgi:predicted dehydrogenase
MIRDLRVALLGQGFMGKAHSNAFAQVDHFYDTPFRIRRTLLCGRDAKSLQTMAARWGWEETSTDWRTAIDREDIDLVDVALPNYLHAEVAIAAARAGTIVLCEKPLSLTVADAEAMVAAAKNVRTMVWYNYRRVPAITFAHQLIEDGRLGTIYHYDAAYRQQWGPDRSREGTWKMDPSQAGSGVADDLLTHLLDTALYLNGRIAEGLAMRKTFTPGRAIDDAFLALLKFANGSVGQFQATRFGIGCRNANTFQIHGSGGMLRFNLERLNHLGFADANDPAVDQGTRDILVTDMEHPVFPHFWRPAHIIGYEHTFVAALGEFLDAVHRDAEFHPDFEDGLAVQRILAALQESATSGRWTRITD